MLKTMALIYLQAKAVAEIGGGLRKISLAEE